MRLRTLTALLLGLALCASCASREGEKYDLTAYSGQALPFSLGLPSDWQRVDDPAALRRYDPTGMLLLLSLRPDGGGATVHQTISVVKERIATPLTVGEYLDKTVVSLEGLLQEFKVEDRKKTKLGGRDWEEMTYAHARGGQGIKALVAAVVVGDEVYSVTCTSSPDEYAAILPLFRQVLASIAFDR